MYADIFPEAGSIMGTYKNRSSFLARVRRIKQATTWYLGEVMKLALQKWLAKSSKWAELSGCSRLSVSRNQPHSRKEFKYMMRAVMRALAPVDTVDALLTLYWLLFDLIFHAQGRSGSVKQA